MSQSTNSWFRCVANLCNYESCILFIDNDLLKKIESSKIYIQKMILITSLVLLLIIKLRFPKGKSIHREIYVSVMNLVLKNSLLIQNTKLAFTENRIQYIQVSIMTTKDINFPFIKFHSLNKLRVITQILIIIQPLS